MQEGDGFYLVTVITAEMLMLNLKSGSQRKGGGIKCILHFSSEMGRGLLVIAGVGLAFLVILWLSSFQTHVQRAGRKLQMQSELLCL